MGMKHAVALHVRRALPVLPCLQLEPALMASLPEGRWWYQEGSRTNCAERKLLGSCESQKDLDVSKHRPAS